jgi:hypothetical protein
MFGRVLLQLALVLEVGSLDVVDEPEISHTHRVTEPCDTDHRTLK